MADVIFNGGEMKLYHRPEPVEMAEITDVFDNDTVRIIDATGAWREVSHPGLFANGTPQPGDWLQVWKVSKQQITWISAAEFETDWMPVAGAGLL